MSDYSEIEIRKFSIDKLTDEILEDMREVLDLAYHNSKMYESLRKDVQEEHEVFRAYIAFNGSKVVGVAVVEDKLHKNLDYQGHKPIHLKRFTTHPNYRGRGIGKQLIDKAKDFVFNDLSISVMFGESNEASGLSFYGKEGCLYSVNDIKTYSSRNSPEDNLKFFCKLISDSSLVRFRYQKGDGIPFVFCNDGTTEQQFKEKGYKSKTELIQTS